LAGQSTESTWKSNSAIPPAPELDGNIGACADRRALGVLVICIIQLPCCSCMDRMDGARKTYSWRRHVALSCGGGPDALSGLGLWLYLQLRGIRACVYVHLRLWLCSHGLSAFGGVLNTAPRGDGGLPPAFSWREIPKHDLEGLVLFPIPKILRSGVLIILFILHGRVK